MIREYKIQKRLGIGSYGTVYQVSHKETNKIYVIKQIPLFNLTQEEISNVKLEAKILKTINSKYVVKYYDSFLENNHLNIVMEYCNGGDLGQYIDTHKNKNEKISEELIWLIFIKITLGLASIHKLKILHRDLKTLNIFLSKNLEIKVGDLGVAKILNHSGSFAKTLIGTPYYLSPELCEEKPYNNKSDIWALGCILYELCTFNHPFSAKSQASLILKILKEHPQPIGKEYSMELQNIINNIFDKNMEKRPSCFDILTNDIVLNKAKNFGLINEIMKLYPDYNGFNIYKNNIKNNNIINKRILLYNKNRVKEIHKKNNSFVNIKSNESNNNYNSGNKSKDSIYMNKNKIKNKKRFNSISTESKIINYNLNKEKKNYDGLNINKLFPNLTPMDNNVNKQILLNKMKEKNINHKLFIKKFLNKSQDKNDICKNNDNGRYTNTDRKKMILIKKSGKNIIKSSKSANKIFIDLNDFSKNQPLKKGDQFQRNNKSIENKSIFIKKSNSKINGNENIFKNNAIKSNGNVNKNEERKNEIIEDNNKYIININKNQEKVNINNSIEIFENELKNYYKYPSNNKYIQNGINSKNKISNENDIKLNTIDILNDDKEIDNNKNNNLNDFVKNLNQYIPQYKISKQNNHININKYKIINHT